MAGGTHSTLQGFATNDTLQAHVDGATIYDIVHGAAGSDTLSVGLPANGPATLYGDGGNDTLTGGGGDDILYGGVGRDTVAGGAGDDQFFVGGGELATGEVYGGDDGFDTFIYTGANAIDLSAVSLSGMEGYSSTQHADLSLTAAQLDGFSNVSGLGVITVTTGGAIDLSGGVVTSGEIHLNSAGNTLNLTGDAGDGVHGYHVIGGAGNNVITGGTLGDQIVGGVGNDILNGGAGDDELKGVGGNDQMFGGEGDDTLWIRPRFPTGSVYDGGAGFDTLAFNEMGNIIVDLTRATITGMESLSTVDGDVSLSSTLAENFSTISAWYITLASGGVADLHDHTLKVYNFFLNGAAGLDLTGDSNTFDDDGGYRVISYAGDVVIRGGIGDDDLSGYVGDDILTGGPGDDQLQGWVGIDTADYSTATAAVNVSLLLQDAAQGTGGAGTDVLRGFENLTGGAGGDTLTGDAGDNVLSGGAGDDILKGGSGNDTLLGGDGDDRLSGNRGDNVINGGDGDDIMSAGLGNTSFNGGPGFDTVDDSAFAGALTIDLTSQSPQDTGAAGIDSFALVEHLIGGSGGDHFIGSGGMLLEGGGGNDTLTIAFGGGATLSGGAGDDVLNGGRGAETLVGGAGHDVMTGGQALRAGPLAQDLFVFNDISDSVVGAGRDQITDFYQGVNHIDLSHIDADIGMAGDQAFHFIKTNAFNGVAGELHYTLAGATAIVEGDVNGDGVADFQIEIDFFTSNHTLNASSFVL